MNMHHDLLYFNLQSCTQVTGAIDFNLYPQSIIFPLKAASNSYWERKSMGKTGILYRTEIVAA